MFRWLIGFLKWFNMTPIQFGTAAFMGFAISTLTQHGPLSDFDQQKLWWGLVVWMAVHQLDRILARR